MISTAAVTGAGGCYAMPLHTGSHSLLELAVSALVSRASVSHRRARNRQRFPWRAGLRIELADVAGELGGGPVAVLVGDEAMRPGIRETPLSGSTPKRTLSQCGGEKLWSPMGQHSQWASPDCGGFAAYDGASADDSFGGIALSFARS